MAPRLALPVGLLLAPALLLGLLAPSYPAYTFAFFLIYGVIATMVFLTQAQGGGGAALGPIGDALRDLRRGRAPRTPEGASAELTSLFEEVERIAEERAELDTKLDEIGKERTELQSMLKKAEREVETAKRDVERARADGAKSAGSPPEVTESVGTVGEAVVEVDGVIPALTQIAAEFGGYVRAANQSLLEIYQSIETLATSAEESSSSILEMTTTNEEVAQNVGELATSVRETATSIEEMAYSIREVARNIDALSLTAEETSSSMNEMDVSIDQVQTNANETARLSEEVALDAERGAEAILKTISEINRIRESSQEAVAVISNLNTRIEAIGQILAVIDDVAEQTNLLALNAAIIAAQAGEHGKGFAVVADEIKDLAERAGGSTKEIAELIKTIQAESRNAINAVERGAQNVSRGVEVSNEAERALKKILESSQKSTTMVRAIARATVEQAKGSKQVTDAIGRIAETVQQIAAATAQQARGSDQIMKSAEKMRMITQQVERSSQEQARGGRQITAAIEQISNMVNTLSGSQRAQTRTGEQLLDLNRKLEDLARMQADRFKGLKSAYGRLERALGVVKH